MPSLGPLKLLSSKCFILDVIKTLLLLNSESYTFLKCDLVYSACFLVHCCGTFSCVYGCYCAFFDPSSFCHPIQDNAIVLNAASATASVAGCYMQEFCVQTGTCTTERKKKKVKHSCRVVEHNKTCHYLFILLCQKCLKIRISLCIYCSIFWRMN